MRPGVEICLWPPEKCSLWEKCQHAHAKPGEIVTRHICWTIWGEGCRAFKPIEETEEEK